MAYCHVFWVLVCIPTGDGWERGKEYGTELFYNVEVTPWLHITGDLQYVNPAEEQRDSDVVLGIRSNIRF